MRHVQQTGETDTRRRNRRWWWATEVFPSCYFSFSLSLTHSHCCCWISLIQSLSLTLLFVVDLNFCVTHRKCVCVGEPQLFRVELNQQKFGNYHIHQHGVDTLRFAHYKMWSTLEKHTQKSKFSGSHAVRVFVWEPTIANAAVDVTFDEREAECHEYFSKKHSRSIISSHKLTRAKTQSNFPW